MPRRVGRPRGRQGQGVKSTAKKLAKKMAPTLINKVLVPMIEKQIGMKVRSGGALKLAGQRGRAGGAKKKVGRKRRVGRPRKRK